MEFYQLLKTYRETLGIPQKEIARRLNVTASTLSRYENGSRRISTEAIPEFQRAYSLPDQLVIDALFGSRDKLRLQPDQTKELQEQYYKSYFDLYQDVLMDASFRRFITEFTELPSEIRPILIRKFTDDIRRQRAANPSE
ncbi:helix-turn-helix domain-containing protein [Planococcus lenghuensis]|uniref:HTH cro/C1-type domain-containing protein n=1 Tax=Planococcus lenghuensis TaxID=2213202 RepID=A0A1Q2L1F5_9BACL|nr:helix-turn-helix domain-containing protein [Planococcus lenghuensis]AQQ54261.1 hypothetical protein B0X71_14915 [Planococcus lenghuensis]